MKGDKCSWSPVKGEGPEFKLEKQLGARPPGAGEMGRGLDFILSALGSHWSEWEVQNKTIRSRIWSFFFFFPQKSLTLDFPGGPGVNNLSANAGTRVQILVWEDPTGHRTIKSMHLNYWACAPQQEKSLQWENCNSMKTSPCSPQLEKACTQQQRHSTAKINK